jgi:hypothetical protein
MGSPLLEGGLCLIEGDVYLDGVGDPLAEGSV